MYYIMYDEIDYDILYTNSLRILYNFIDYIKNDYKNNNINNWHDYWYD